MTWCFSATIPGGQVNGGNCAALNGGSRNIRATLSNLHGNLATTNSYTGGWPHVVTYPGITMSCSTSEYCYNVVLLDLSVQQKVEMDGCFDIEGLFHLPVGL